MMAAQVMASEQVTLYRKRRYDEVTFDRAYWASKRKKHGAGAHVVHKASKGARGKH
jgi:hypothetical protein